jgi:hypothetical protein
MTDLSKLAASLSELEKDLLLNRVEGWGSWMWGVAQDLHRKGLFDRDAGGFEHNKLGRQLVDYLKGQSDG